MTLHILLGDYGAGKTATAKYLTEKHNATYLDVEYLAMNNGHLIDRLKTIVKPCEEYYLDGWVGGYRGDVAEMLGVDVKYIVCMASPGRVIKSQKSKAPEVTTPLPRTEYEIEKRLYLTASIALTFDDNPIFVDTTTKPPSFWYKEEWLNRWMEISLYAMFKGKNEYQDIELSDRKVTGLSQSSKTWERLEDFVQFNGKSVCDYGCNYGYFCFKAEEAGASNVTGIDISSSVLDIARSIGITKASRSRFIQAELKSFKPPQSDIIMALNVLHHIDNDGDVLRKIFCNAKTVVMELPEKDLVNIRPMSRAFGFYASAMISSHREDRCIIIFYSDNKTVTVPDKWAYRPKRAALIKKIKRSVFWFVPSFARGIARRLLIKVMEG